jgi:hypothetical protein
MRQYIHEKLGEEIRSVAGYYTITGEERLKYREREVLYVAGLAVIDNSCCGVGGCSFVNVPGYIVSWKKERGDSSPAISEVEPIKDKEDQEEIRKLLTEKYPHAQINF